MKKLYYLGVGFILFSAHLNAQSIEDVKATVNGSNVIITYNLITPEHGQKFDIAIRSSHDEFVSDLVEVTGAVGTNQSPGRGKQIIWDARKEMGAFIGDLSFEVTATVTFTPLVFTNPSAGAGIKIGKSYTVEWKGGSQERGLKLELFRNDNQIMDIGNVDNSGTYTWNVPKTMEKGDNFHFKLLDPTKPSDAIMSARFKLKKTPILIYIGAGAVVAGVVAVVALSGGDEGGGGTTPTTTENPIETPPPPPGGGN